MGNNYVPLYIAIALILIVGMLPLFISPFVPAGNTLKPTDNGYFLYNLFANGENVNFDVPILSRLPFGLGDPFSNISFIIKPLFFLPQSWETTFANYIVNFAYIPAVVAIPLLIIISVSLSYSIIKLFWGN